MRKIRFPKLKAPTIGRHAGTGRAKRTSDPRYKGTHRAVKDHDYVGHPAHPNNAPAAVSRGRTATPRKMTPLDNRPYETNAPKSPRSRFGNADQVAARIDYEKRQRAAQHASQRAGAKKRGPVGISAMGQPASPRSRFSEPSSATKNRVAKQLHPAAPTARGRATRSSSALPGLGHRTAAEKSFSHQARHTADPSPATHGQGFSGFYFGNRPGKG